MNAVAERPARPQDVVRHQLEAMTPQFALALPPHVPAERFVRIVMTAVQSNPDLLNKDRQSLFEASMKCAQDGLLPDGREAALVVHGAKITYMPMVAGILSKVRRSGELKSISAHVAYERDEFDYILGDEERIHHKPFLGEDRGKPIATYAVAHTKDGGVYREVMTEAQVMAVKAISRAKNGPWRGPFADEMRRKTAIRRLSKRLPMSTDLLAVIERDDELYDLNKAQPVQVRRLHADFEALPAPEPEEDQVPDSPLGDDDIPTFDPEEVEASGQGAEAPSGDDDVFPGDR
ncbi:recombinase RecT [Phenylobacterium sp.]|uniref:recombinase RecT n=1 Tax=Phenylobacterium sp. TaxID=1871053 RepID=UPI0028117E36|nr:recombinase RecT [Phenylobacterium sp.]